MYPQNIEEMVFSTQPPQPLGTIELGLKKLGEFYVDFSILSVTGKRESWRSFVSSAEFGVVPLWELWC